MGVHLKAAAILSAVVLGVAPGAQAAPAAAPGSAAKAKASASGGERKGPATVSMEKTFDETRNGVLADKKRDEAIARLEKIIDRTSLDSPARPEMQFQLSELYWEKAKYLYRAEMRQIDAAYKEYEAAKNRGEKRERPADDHSKSERWRGRVVEIYEQILKDAPKYERNDEILFSLGYNLHELGKQPEAIKKYQELIKRFPDSRFVSDTYVQLGDHYFNSNNLAKAKESYEKALKSEVPKVYSYALYKLAWCDYNAGEYEGGLAKLKKVVEYSAEHKEMVDLKNEALNDLVPMFVSLNQVDPAIEYFQAKAPKRKYALLGKMGDQLADAGHHDSSNKVFRYLIEQDPMNPKAPEFQQAIARNFEKLRQRDKVRAEMKVLVERYRPGGAWWVANGKDEGVLRSAFEVTEEAMRTMVTEYHQEAQKTKQVETYRLARDIYKQYVEAFASNSDPSARLGQRVQHALLLRRDPLDARGVGRGGRAVRRGGRVQDPRTARTRSRSRRRSTASRPRTARSSPTASCSRSSRARSRRPRSRTARRSTRRRRRAASTTPSGCSRRTRRTSSSSRSPGSSRSCSPRVTPTCASSPTRPNAKNVRADEKDRELDIRFRAAILTYNKNRFVDAAHRFGEIIAKWPEDNRSQQAADLTMYTLETRQEWFELNRLARQFLENKRLAKPGTDFAARVGQVVEGSQYKWAYEIVYLKEKNPAKAAEEFMKFVAEFPRSKNADRALAGAMLIHQEAGNLDQAIVAGERLLKEYPSSPFGLKARYNLAGAYEKIAEFKKAAETEEGFLAEYEQTASRRREQGAKKADAKAAPVDPEVAAAKKAAADEQKKLFDEAGAWLADAQFNVGLWWAAVGRTDKAIEAYSKYIARYPAKPDVPEVQLAIAQLYERDGKLAEQARALETYAARYGRDSRVKPQDVYLARYRQLLAEQKLKNTRETNRVGDELVRTFKALPDESKKDAAVLNAFTHARFLALEDLWKAYTDVKFARIATIKADLGKKQKKLAEIEKSYFEVLQTGGADYGIAALTRIALAYEDFAANIRNSPNPKGLSEEQLQMYRDQLESLALPLDDKAQEMLGKVIEKSSELSVYTEWTTTAQEHLNKYQPGSFPKAVTAGFRGTEYRQAAPLQTEPAPAAPAAKVGERGEDVASNGSTGA